MTMNRVALLAAAAIVLTGCKTKLSTEVTVNQILSPTPISTEAELAVEVPACNDFKDSRKESPSLVKARQELLATLPKAKYVECYKAGFQNWAVFKTPVIVGKLPFEGQTQDIANASSLDQDAIYIAGKREGNYLMYLHIPNKLKKRLNQAKKKANITSLDIAIRLTNDSGEALPLSMSSVFLDTGKERIPVINSTLINMANNTAWTFGLSDVSVAYALGEMDAAPILYNKTIY